MNISSYQANEAFFDDDDDDECFKSGQKHKSNYVFTACENKSQNNIKKNQRLYFVSHLA